MNAGFIRLKLLKKKNKTWLEKVIEKPIRPLVKLLRENGVNTISSCGHKMTVQADFHDQEYVYNLLIENGWDNFLITTFWEQRPAQLLRRFMEIKFYDKLKKDVQMGNFKKSKCH